MKIATITKLTVNGIAETSHISIRLNDERSDQMMGQSVNPSHMPTQTYHIFTIRSSSEDMSLM